MLARNEGAVKTGLTEPFINSGCSQNAHNPRSHSIEETKLINERSTYIHIPIALHDFLIEHIGDPEVQCALGRCYETGTAIEKDEKQAFFWYQKAAETGHPTGQVYLGDCYLEGVGIEKDKKQAIACYRKAAEQK